MKRLLCFILFPLLLVSCHDASAITVPFEEIERVICDNANQNAEFIKADEDFITASFPFANNVANSAVYLKNEAGTLAEYGIFQLKEGVDRSTVIEGIRSYLLSECDAMRSLAALYPGNTLTENLKRYENAMIASNGNYVWYLATDQKIATAANDAARSALK